MAFIKFRELGKIFNFYKEMPLNDVPEYVLEYVFPGEEIKSIYCTSRDKGLFTNNKIVLFDRKGPLGISKKIDIFPYSKISSSAIVFKSKVVNILFTFESGYQMTLGFINMSPDAKKRLRELYCYINQKICK